MRLRWAARRLLTASTLALAACQAAPQDFARAPHLTPVGTGMKSEHVAAVHSVSAPVATAGSPSTWRDASGDLFRDPRAARVGDVVTVKISIKNSASFDNQSNRSRDAKSGFSGSLSYLMEAIGISKSGSNTVDASLTGQTSTDSKGATTRSESVDFLVAAVITDVLPNGNLLVSGSQEVRVNFEVRVLSVGGIVRPRDLAQDNTISYDKIAEARIEYGGRGRLTEVQQPAVGQQLFDLITPF